MTKYLVRLENLAGRDFPTKESIGNRAGTFAQKDRSSCSACILGSKIWSFCVNCMKLYKNREEIHFRKIKWGILCEKLDFVSA